jgi:hypothetical protein
VFRRHENELAASIDGDLNALPLGAASDLEGEVLND